MSRLPSECASVPTLPPLIHRALLDRSAIKFMGAGAHGAVLSVQLPPLEAVILKFVSLGDKDTCRGLRTEAALIEELQKVPGLIPRSYGSRSNPLYTYTPPKGSPVANILHEHEQEGDVFYVLAMEYLSGYVDLNTALDAEVRAGDHLQKVVHESGRGTEHKQPYPTEEELFGSTEAVSKRGRVTESPLSLMTMRSMYLIGGVHLNREAIAKSLIRGLQAMHSYGVVHCDIKPENILVNPYTGETRYIDLGQAFQMSTADGTRVLGYYKGTTPTYCLSSMYPHIFESEDTLTPPSLKECIQNDWFSLYCTLVDLYLPVWLGDRVKTPSGARRAWFSVLQANYLTPEERSAVLSNTRLKVELSGAFGKLNGAKQHMDTLVKHYFRGKYGLPEFGETLRSAQDEVKVLDANLNRLINTSEIKLGKGKPPMPLRSIHRDFMEVTLSWILISSIGPRVTHEAFAELSDLLPSSMIVPTSDRSLITQWERLCGEKLERMSRW